MKKILIELREANEDEDGRTHGFVCEAKAGTLTVLRFPPVKDVDGSMLDLSLPLVDLIAEYDGCYTPGQALRVFGEALDMALAKDGWEAMHEAATKV